MNSILQYANFRRQALTHQCSVVPLSTQSFFFFLIFWQILDYRYAPVVMSKLSIWCHQLLGQRVLVTWLTSQMLWLISVATHNENRKETHSCPIECYLFIVFGQFFKLFQTCIFDLCFTSCFREPENHTSVQAFLYFDSKMKTRGPQCDFFQFLTVCNKQQLKYSSDCHYH